MKAQDAQVFDLDEEFLLSAALTAKLEQTSFLLDVDEADDVDDNSSVPLLAQLFSSMLGFRVVEFAVPLLLITYFNDTLLPNAIYGFSSCVTNILLAQWLGALVDRVPKLTLVRGCMIGQRLSAFVVCAACASLFYWQKMCEARGVAGPQSITMPAFRVVMLAGAVLQGSNTCLNIALQQDWVTCVSSGSSTRLSVLNGRVKRLDLVCKLLAPLLVSLLSTRLSHSTTAATIAGMMLLLLLVDVFCLRFVYESCPSLGREQAHRDERVRVQERSRMTMQSLGLPVPSRAACWNPRRVVSHWLEFSQLPTLLSSVAAAFLAMNVLSLDGPMLSFLKTQGYTDNALSLMRGLNILAGFGGTLLAPLLERRLASVRSGTWSIWPAVACLSPTIVALHFVWTAQQQVAATMMFGGIVMSGIGLWSFEVVQVKQLQMAVEDHPQRNTLISLQFTLQHLSDLMKYVLTMFFFSNPSDFKWTALISFGSAVMGAFTYAQYAKRARGYYFH